MSATNRGAERQADDFYQTPFWCVDRLVERFLFLKKPTTRILEPCAGQGAIVKALPTPRWTLNEINPDFEDSLSVLGDHIVWTIGDFLEYNSTSVFDCILTNPPFCLAQEIVEKSFGLKPLIGTFMLLRVNFLGSLKRSAWLRKNTPSVYVLPNRPVFGYNKDGKLGTDATEYAWFYWPANHSGLYRSTFGLNPEIAILEETPKEDLQKHLDFLRSNPPK